MNKVLIVLGCFLLLLAGATHADSISSSIVCNGATWVSCSVISEAQAYAASLFTSDYAVLHRKLDLGETISALVSGRSEGPMGVDEYASQVQNQTTRASTCLFTDPDHGTGRQDEVSATGLLLQGEYVSTRILGEKTVAGSVVNGTGILLLKACSDDGNRTVSHASDIAGSMNVSEEIVFGDGYDD